jgi:hypothetical protein
MEKFPPCSKEGILPHAWTIVVVVMQLERTTWKHKLKSKNLINSNFGLSFDDKVVEDFFKCWIKFFSPIINIAPYSYTNIFHVNIMHFN